MKYKRLNQNITILNMHNHSFRSVKQLTNGEKTENQVIDEIVHDTIEILDKIGKGTLIELPCEIGDLVYFVSKKNGIRFSTINEIKTHIDFTGIVGIEVRDDDYKWHTVNNRTVLLDEEEAEKRLKELQE